MPRTPDFTEIFDAHWPRVCAYVARRTQAAVAEDVAAEVFAIAWRRRAELPRDVLPWLLRTAANLLATSGGPTRGAPSSARGSARPLPRPRAPRRPRSGRTPGP